MSSNCHLFIFGYGYSAAALTRQVLAQGGRVAGTSRHGLQRYTMQQLGIAAYDFPDEAIPSALAEATHLLVSIPPTRLGDTVLKHYTPAIADFAEKNRWIGYLSTTGVYGDHAGEWVDETTAVDATRLPERLVSRVVAERKWLTHQAHIFRLAGIYGPGRGVLQKLRSGKARSIYKEGQVFSRIHVADISRALLASMRQPAPGSIYNLCDDLPAPSHEVTEFAAVRLGLPKPPRIDWQETPLSPMEAEFYASNRRVRNERIKALLPAQEWLYPTYREGIVADINAC